MIITCNYCMMVTLFFNECDNTVIFPYFRLMICACAFVSTIALPFKILHDAYTLEYQVYSSYAGWSRKNATSYFHLSEAYTLDMWG